MNCFCLLFLALLPANSAIATTELNQWLLEGHELHPEINTQAFGHQAIRHVPTHIIKANPQVSSNPEFIAAIVRSGSQGRRSSKGIKAALYAWYQGDNDLGIYGMEAESLPVAKQTEAELLTIWKHNISMDRARIHRFGKVLLVVWTDGVSKPVWEHVNQALIHHSEVIQSNREEHEIHH